MPLASLPQNVLLDLSATRHGETILVVYHNHVFRYLVTRDPMVQEGVHSFQCDMRRRFGRFGYDPCADLDSIKNSVMCLG